MGWEKRRHGRVYYYRAVRINGRPRHVYLGTGGLGRIHELLDRRQRREQAAATEAKRHLKSTLLEMDCLWSTTWKWARALASTSLLTAGYYTHNGQWRKKMETPRTRQKKPRPATPEEAADLRTRLAALNDRANTGDAVALAELKAFLDQHPEVWQTVGDMNQISVRRWLTLIAGQDSLYKESITRVINAWKTELVGAAASATEKALVETAVVARLALMHSELLATADGDQIKTAEFKVKRLDAALHRFNATLKLLTQVRSAYPNGLAPVSAPAAGLPRIYTPPSKRKKAG